MLALMFLAVVLLALAALYVHDKRQVHHTILRNYPIIGYFRYFAETLGEYMRQYQYPPDWAERPFNRLERGWVYRSAKGVSNLHSFGSENVPAFVFRNAAFPVLDRKSCPIRASRSDSVRALTPTGTRISRKPSSTSAA
jgi:hypothetical protein